MSWLNFLAPLATGFVRGFSAEWARPEPAARPCFHPSRHDFPSLMFAYGQAAGLRPPKLHNRSVAFTVPVQGVPYMVLFSAGPDCVIASAHSNLHFPGEVPRSVQIAMANINRKDQSGCCYDQIEHDTGVSLCSMTKVDLHEFTQPVFERMLHQLTNRVAALDRVLVQDGYGR